MHPPRRRDHPRHPRVLRLAAAVLPFLLAQGQAQADAAPTRTPIRHLVVVIGENRGFDHVFATYVPRAGESVANLLSKGIVKADGAPGPNAARARQVAANPPFPPRYVLNAAAKTAYAPFLPPPGLGGAPAKATSLADLLAQPTRARPPFDATVDDAALQRLEPALPRTALALLRSGATGALDRTGPDRRVRGWDRLPNTVFRLTGPDLPYDAYTGDMAHRFFQMWQQVDCDRAAGTAADPAGCRNDLYVFVGIARGGGAGSSAMGFYDMQTGDAPTLKRLADEFTLADNFHQGVMGGTAANHILLGTGDVLAWTPFEEQAAPPADRIANPDPHAPTSARYTQDQRFVGCADRAQPGVAAIRDFLESLPYPVAANCAPGRAYMINNTSPGFLANGAVDRPWIAAGNAMPPSDLRTIGDALDEKGIDWAYFAGGYAAALRAAAGAPDDAIDRVAAAGYCDICNFANYASSIMTDPARRTAHLKDLVDFLAAVDRGALPAVAFVKPDSFLDGHPATSKLGLFEALLEHLVERLMLKPDLFAETALLVLFDEAGGYYDSGFIQPLDFFGDGPRVPLVAVSPFSRGGRVVHTYYDHASVLKFIERNWGLAPLTGRSRDNLPNPMARPDDPYVPANMPAIGDLMELFDFGGRG